MTYRILIVGSGLPGRMGANNEQKVLGAEKQDLQRLYGEIAFIDAWPRTAKELDTLCSLHQPARIIVRHGSPLSFIPSDRTRKFLRTFRYEGGERSFGRYRHPERRQVAA